MRMFLAAIGLMLGLAVPLWAGELDERQVAAEAKWLVHVDLDAARESTIGRQFHAAMLKNDQAKQRLEATGKLLGLDPAKDVHGMLLYDRRFAHQRGVVIIRADADVKRLTAFVEKLPDYKNSDADGHRFHTFTHKKHSPSGHPLTVCFHDEGIVLGRSKADVVAAVEVLDGKSTDLSGDGVPLGGIATVGQSLSPGTIVQIRATGLDGGDVPFKSPIVRQSKTLVMIAGEHEGEAFARARLVTASAEVAQQIKAVVDGFLAVAQLQAGENEEARKLFRAAKVGVEGYVVTVQWKGRAEDLLKIAKNRMKRNGKGRHVNKHDSR